MKKQHHDSFAAPSRLTLAGVASAALLAACGAGTGLPDETLSSQALPGGASACLYENANYGGASLCVKTNNQRFTTWDNRVSSARVEAGRRLRQPQARPAVTERRRDFEGMMDHLGSRGGCR